MILLKVLLLYSLLISLLLVFKGCEKPATVDISHLKKVKDSLILENEKLNDLNLEWKIKFRDLQIRLDRIDSHIVDLNVRKDKVKIYYTDRINDLSNVTEDSLKKTALME